MIWNVPLIISLSNLVLGVSWYTNNLRIFVTLLVGETAKPVGSVTLIGNRGDVDSAHEITEQNGYVGFTAKLSQWL